MGEQRVPRDRNARLVFATGEDIPRATERIRRRTNAPVRRDASVRIRLEQRRGGRLVTIVTGVPAAADELAELARTLKAACGTGGTVKDSTFELQGDQRDAVEQALRLRGLRPKRAGA